MNYIKRYTDFLKKYLKPAKKVRAVFDCSNGTTGLVLKELFRESKETHQLISSQLINWRPDGRFPAHGPNPMNKGAMADLIAAVKRLKADLGVIFDGDGDRAFFMDNKGQPIVADIVIALIGKNYKGPLVIDPRVGYLAREIAAATGKKVYDSRVGHFFMKQVMAKHKFSFGGELSGHYYFNFGDYYADSGIFAAIQFINAVSKLDSDLAGWINKLPRYYRSGEVNFKVQDKQKLMEKIERAYKSRAQKISHLDGVKMEFADFWLNVRPSNTEDLLRLNLEARNKKVFDYEFAHLKGIME